jgi:hypothetical protein
VGLGHGGFGFCEDKNICQGCCRGAVIDFSWPGWQDALRAARAATTYGVMRQASKARIDEVLGETVA